MDLRGESCFFRYCRNASPTRLLIYGVVAIAVLVVIILLFTLLPSKSGDGPAVGHEVLKFVPLVDGYNALPALLMNKLNGTLAKFPFEKNLADDKSLSWCKTDLPRLKNGMVSTQVWSVRSSCRSQYKDAAAKTLQQVDLIRRLISQHKDEMKLITSADDIANNFNSDPKLGSVIAIDGGHSIDNKLAALRMYYDLGVRCMALISGCDTAWAVGSSSSAQNISSLSNFGKVVIKEMNRLGMIIDLGQASSHTQLAALEVTQAPVIFTKQGTQAVASHMQNIENEVLDKVKKNNGLVLITFDGKPLTNDNGSTAVTLKNVVARINYIRQVVGVDNVGLGAGFNADGSAQISDLEDSSTYPSLFDRLAQPEKGETKWTPDDLSKLAGQNFVRVWKAVEEVSASKVADSPNELLINASDIPSNKRDCYTVN